MSYIPQTLPLALRRITLLVEILRERLVRSSPPPCVRGEQDHLLDDLVDLGIVPAELMVAVEIVGRETGGTAAQQWVNTLWRAAVDELEQQKPAYPTWRD